MADRGQLDTAFAGEGLLTEPEDHEMKSENLSDETCFDSIICLIELAEIETLEVQAFDGGCRVENDFVKADFDSLEAFCKAVCAFFGRSQEDQTLNPKKVVLVKEFVVNLFFRAAGVEVVEFEIHSSLVLLEQDFIFFGVEEFCKLLCITHLFFPE